MKSLKLIAMVLLASFAASLVVGSPAVARTGSACSKAGQVRKISGIEHICQPVVVASKGKSTKKLQWVRRTSSASSGDSSSNSTASTGGIALGQWRINHSSSAAAKEQKCSSAGTLSQMSNGSRVICVDKDGDMRWALAPDSISQQSHSRLVEWLRTVLPALPTDTRPVVMHVEPSYRAADAALIRQLIDATKGFYAGFSKSFVFVLSTSAQHFYDTSREAMGARYGAASQQDRDQFEFKYRASKMETVIGAGHAGISADQTILWSKPSYANSSTTKAMSQVRVVEDFLREYVTEIPRFEIVRHVDGEAAERQCWLLESGGWSLAWALMEYLKVPGFNYSEQWAFWLSELADYEGSYKFGLNASEKSEGLRNGYPRYDMPCQSVPGVGHIQGTLARELLISKVGVRKFEEFVASDQLRQSFSRILGFSYDSWIAESDTRTRALLDKYNSGQTYVPIKSLSKSPANAAEEQALADVSLLIADMQRSGPAGGYQSVHEFFPAFQTSRDKTQQGSRKVWELTRDWGLAATLVISESSGACVLVVFDTETREVSAYPAGTGSVNSNYVGIPPSRRCESSASAPSTNSRLAEILKSLSTTPKSAAEASAIADVAVMIAEISAASPAGGYANLTDFFKAFSSARDRTQSGTRRVWELTRDGAIGLSLVVSQNALACVLVAYDLGANKIYAFPAGVYTPNTRFASMPASYRCD